jgi:hypothetical protein
MAEPGDDFFVGYLRAPLRLVRFLAVFVALLLLAVDAAALVAYRVQEARATGDWGTDGEVALDGVLLARPYPVVIVPATAEHPANAVLLVSEGKHGAPAGLAALDGLRVTVQGYPLLRDDLTVLQLSQPPRRSSMPGGAPALVATALGQRTLRGEIADAKCFLGAMNPGEGKVHAGCASLCLLGDVPPLFVTRDAAGKLTYRLLADQDGGPNPEGAANRAGASLTLTGTLSRIGPLEIFAVPRASLD